MRQSPNTNNKPSTSSSARINHRGQGAALAETLYQVQTGVPKQSDLKKPPFPLKCHLCLFGAVLMICGGCLCFWSATTEAPTPSTPIKQDTLLGADVSPPPDGQGDLLLLKRDPRLPPSSCILFPTASSINIALEEHVAYCTELKALHLGKVGWFYNGSGVVVTNPSSFFSHGYGSLLGPKGSTAYSGHWKFGKAHGYGMQEDFHYNAEFKNFTTKVKSSYAGHWRWGIMDGYGTQVFNGTVTTGGWKQGLKHGRHLAEFPNGNTLEAQYHYGVAFGTGIYTFVKNGSVQTIHDVSDLYDVKRSKGEWGDTLLLFSGAFLRWQRALGVAHNVSTVIVRYLRHVDRWVSSMRPKAVMLVDAAPTSVSSSSSSAVGAATTTSAATGSSSAAATVQPASTCVYTLEMLELGTEPPSGSCEGPMARAAAKRQATANSECGIGQIIISVATEATSGVTTTICGECYPGHSFLEDGACRLGQYCGDTGQCADLTTQVFLGQPCVWSLDSHTSEGLCGVGLRCIENTCRECTPGLTYASMALTCSSSGFWVPITGVTGEGAESSSSSGSSTSGAQIATSVFTAFIFLLLICRLALLHVLPIWRRSRGHSKQSSSSSGGGGGGRVRSRSRASYNSSEGTTASSTIEVQPRSGQHRSEVNISAESPNPIATSEGLPYGGPQRHSQPLGTRYNNNSNTTSASEADLFHGHPTRGRGALISHVGNDSPLARAPVLTQQHGSSSSRGHHHRGTGSPRPPLGTGESAGHAQSHSHHHRRHRRGGQPLDGPALQASPMAPLPAASVQTSPLAAHRYSSPHLVEGESRQARSGSRHSLPHDPNSPLMKPLHEAQHELRPMSPRGGSPGAGTPTHHSGFPSDNEPTTDITTAQKHKRRYTNRETRCSPTQQERITTPANQGARITQPTSETTSRCSGGEHH